MDRFVKLSELEIIDEQIVELQDQITELSDYSIFDGNGTEQNIESILDGNGN